MKRRDEPFKLISTPSGQRQWYADFCDARLALKLGKKTARIVFSLGLTEHATTAQVWREYNKRLDDLRNAEQRHEIIAALQRFISVRKSSNLDPKSIKEYERVWNHFLPLVNERRLTYTSELRPDIIADYAAAQRARGRKPGGILSDMQQLSTILSTWSDWGYMPQGFAARVWFGTIRQKLRADNKSNTRRWRMVLDHEIPPLLNDPVLGDVFTWALLSGQRIGVILQLRQQDIRDGVVTYPPGKGGEVHRQPITAEMQEFLQAHKPVSTMGFMFWRDKWGDPFNPKQRDNAETIVNHRLQRRLIREVYSNEYKAERERLKQEFGRAPAHHEIIAGIDLPHTHNFRATTATMLVDSGMPTSRAARFIGWKTDEMLNRIYDRRKPEDIQVPSILGMKSNVRSINE